MIRKLLGMAGLALLAIGCSSSGDSGNTTTSGSTGTTTGTGPKAEGKTYNIGMSQCTVKEPWRVQMDADVEAAAKLHPEINLTVRDADDDPLKQRSQVEEFISQKVDLLIISPKDVSLTDTVAKAYDAGIPVIVLDRAVNGDKYTCFIGANNVKIGKALGTWMKDKLGGKGTVVELMGAQTSVPGQDRHKGFMEGIAGSSITVAFSADVDWKEDKGRSEMESALSRLKHIDAVYGHNDPAAHGAFLAAQQAGRDKEMIFIGIDALPQEGVQYVSKGMLAATFQYPTGGADAIETALKILHGDKVEKQIVLGSRLFTPENVASGGEALP